MAAAIADILPYCVALMAIVRRRHCILQPNITPLVLDDRPCGGGLINWPRYPDIDRNIITIYNNE